MRHLRHLRLGKYGWWWKLHRRQSGPAWRRCRRWRNWRSTQPLQIAQRRAGNNPGKLARSSRGGCRGGGLLHWRGGERLGKRRLSERRLSHGRLRCLPGSRFGRECLEKPRKSSGSRTWSSRRLRYWRHQGFSCMSRNGLVLVQRLKKLSKSTLSWRQGFRGTCRAA